MSCLSLNCRGLGNPDAVGGLRNLIRREAPAMIFLCETKLSSRDMSRIINRVDGYTGVAVDSVGRSGGLAFLWKEGMSCVLRAAMVHCMDFDIELDGLKWRFTGFYGWPAVQDRRLSWRLLRMLAGEESGPWLCIGDFNEILYSTEMKGGSRAQWQMNNFRDAVDEAGIRDIPMEGYEFTFDNGQVGEDNRQSRIDRAMANEAWFELYPYARLLHLNREWSDHCPIKVIEDRRVGHDGRGDKLFRFEHIWGGGGRMGVRRLYGVGGTMGGGDFTESLARCARELLEWKGVSIGKILKCLAKKRERLKELNEGDRSARRVQERKKVVLEIASLLRQEEKFWRQRSRAIWLRDGDRNSKFFHRVASERKQKNFISKVSDEQGRVYEGTEAVSRCDVDYFRELFGSGAPEGFGDLLAVVEGKVTGEMNEGLAADYSGEEVVVALSQMHPLKASGPDGMNGFFYKLIGILLVLR
ncbi:uncharacterized protein LOC141648573 [Silene latifolia]|uniref:uncharacterized protein LOC141648573 n=1 Tax=Silene latifolia TaxID=37657 RepID=UPI003D77EA89